MTIQLDLFRTPEECDSIDLRKRMDKVEASCTKVRKAQFAQIGELKKLLLDINSRMAVIEHHLCKDEKTQSECCDQKT